MVMVIKPDGSMEKFEEAKFDESALASLVSGKR
jgi:hypothetical protein